MDDFIAYFYSRLKKTAIVDLFLATSLRPPLSLQFFRAQILNGDSWNGLKINQSREMCDRYCPSPIPAGKKPF